MLDASITSSAISAQLVLIAPLTVIASTQVYWASIVPSITKLWPFCTERIPSSLCRTTARASNTRRQIGDIPVVTTRGAAPFEHHSVRLHLTWRNPPLRRRCIADGFSEAETTGLEDGIQVFVMLLPDLPALCNMMGSEFALTPGPCVYVTSSTITLSRPITGQTNTIASTAIALIDTPYQNMTFDLQQRILRPLEAMSGACQKAVIKGGDQTSTEQVMRSMCPQLVWPSAIFWTLYDDISTQKKKADDLAVSGKPAETLARYNYILKLSILESLGHLIPFEIKISDDDCKAALARIAIIAADCLLSRIWLSVRLGERALSGGEAKRILPTICKPFYLSGIPLHGHATMVNCLVMEDPEGNKTDRVRIALKELKITANYPLWLSTRTWRTT